MPSICFLTHVHDFTSWCLMQQNAFGWLYHHPEAQLIIISDGSIPQLNPSLNSDLFGRAVFIQEESIKKPPYTAWISRFLKLFTLFNPSDYLIRVDPDTVCHRRINFIPKAALFGTFLHGSQPHIQGGCLGFSRSLAEEFLVTSIKDSKIKPITNSSNEHYSDLVLFDIVKNQLDAPVANWSEVKCHPFTEPKWKNRKRDFEDFAFTHPHKRVDNV